MFEKVKRLDLGAGNSKLKGYLSVDVLSSVGPDVVHDLNVFPYPFDDDSIDFINMDNVLEHLLEPIDVLREVHRILKFGGKAVIKVPYYRSYWAYIDPTHRNYFSSTFFDYFDPANDICNAYRYFDFAFKCEEVVFNEKLNNRFFKKGVVAFANRFRYQYELYLSHILPLDQITFKIEKI